jgi:hypothetical protein
MSVMTLAAILLGVAVLVAALLLARLSWRRLRASARKPTRVHLEEATPDDVWPDLDFGDEEDPIAKLFRDVLARGTQSA